MGYNRNTDTLLNSSTEESHADYTYKQQLKGNMNRHAPFKNSWAWLYF